MSDKTMEGISREILRLNKNLGIDINITAVKAEKNKALVWRILSTHKEGLVYDVSMSPAQLLRTLQIFNTLLEFKG